MIEKKYNHNEVLGDELDGFLLKGQFEWVLGAAAGIWLDIGRCEGGNNMYHLCQPMMYSEVYFEIYKYIS